MTNHAERLMRARVVLAHRALRDVHHVVMHGDVTTETFILHGERVRKWQYHDECALLSL